MATLIRIPGQRKPNPKYTEEWLFLNLPLLRRSIAILRVLMVFALLFLQ